MLSSVWHSLSDMVRRRPAPDGSLLPAAPFPLTEALCARIRADVAATGKRPTESQWQMVLSPSRNTGVNAGAGSGKSTTLILRALVLHRYLGIPLEEITIFSFTRASTQEFRSKLIEAFAAHGITVSTEQAQRTVRTFHSKLLELARGGVPGSQVFDLLGTPEPDAGAAKSDAGLPDLRFGDPQDQLLRRAYERCAATDTAFREAATSLYLHYLRGLQRRPNKKELKAAALQLAAKNDLEVWRRSREAFGEGSAEPIPFKLRHLQSDLVFHANDYLPTLKAYVIFAPDRRLLGAAADIDVGGFPLAQRVIIKGQLLATHGDERLRFASSHDELARHREEERAAAALERGEPNAPVFDFALAGDLRPAPIWRALCEAAQFAEMLGTEPTKLLDHAGDLDPQDRLFVGMLAPFWRTFAVLLAEERLSRFGGLFARYSERHPAHFSELQPGVLRSMSHLLIDEFQDVSPEVVGWLRGVLRALRTQGVETSLLCVGDDYQSIYGWRGSSPRYFLRYRDEFPSADVRTVQMKDNFRCGQQIIDQAERLLAGIPAASRTAKHGRSARPQSGTVLFEPSEDPRMVAERAGLYVVRWREQNPGKAFARGREPVLVLTRTKALRSAVDGALGRLPAEQQRGIRVMTFHGSKGLEATFAVLVGDCAHDRRSPFRNAVYQLAGFDGSYDQAQREEALRLAYVAMTRACEEVTWFAEPTAAGCFRMAAAGRPDSPR